MIKIKFNSYGMGSTIEIDGKDIKHVTEFDLHAGVDGTKLTVKRFLDLDVEPTIVTDEYVNEPIYIEQAE